jgi:nucleoside-diphosphate-sugar epimerase
MSRVLVTGGAGFIGSHLVAALVQRGDSVRVLDNFATGRRANVAPFADEVELIEGDIRSPERVARAVAGCEAVLHQAALPSVPRSVQDPLTSHETNVTGTLNVLLAARDHGVRRVIYASSSSVYGPGVDGGLAPKHEDMPPLPISPYATAKLAGEGYARSFGRIYGLETVALRYFNVFGPGQDPASEYAAVIPRFIVSLLAQRPPIVFGDGTQSRDFTFVGNVVAANLLALEAPGAAGRVFNVACGRRVSLNELLGVLRELTGADVPAIHDDPRPGEVEHSVADLGNARRGLGYEPRVAAREGLAVTTEHFRQLAEGRGEGLSAVEAGRA